MKVKGNQHLTYHNKRLSSSYEKLTRYLILLYQEVNRSTDDRFEQKTNS